MNSAVDVGVSPIETDRLRLYPSDVDTARSALRDPALLGGLLGVRIPDGWPSRELRDALPVYVRELERDPRLLGWRLWFVLVRDRRALAGDVGFKGSPNNRGEVEIGYGIAPGFRGRGIASEAVAALVQRAFAWGAEAVVAECLPSNLPSIAVLEKIGMKRTGIDGEMLRWRLEKASS